jgi:uncharacterized protein
MSGLSGEASNPELRGALGQVAGPVAGRIDAIDALRGLALFGVLAINLDTEFRVTLFEQFLRQSPSPFLDRFAAQVLKFFFEFKAFSLFAFLFGMGLAIQFDNLARHKNRLTLLVRRLFALLLFGVVHLVLIWNGDILTEYAIAGLLVLPFLYWSPAVAATAAIAAFALYVAMPWMPLPFGFPSQNWIANHVVTAREVYGHGAFVEVLAFRISELPQVAVLHAYALPRTVAMMFLGIWTWRLRLVDDHALLGATATVALGAAVVFALAPVWPVVGMLLPAVQALGYAAIVFWVFNGSDHAKWIAWAAPIGRMAFTNYVAQSLLLGLLFYGYGLGLMGKLGPASAFLIGIALFSAQAVISRWWLIAHQFGPLEWMWRSMTYGRRQPWKIPSPPLRTT